MTAGTPPAGAAPAAVPWRRLAWVTWRQHRTALTWMLIALALTATGLALADVTVRHAGAEHRYFSLMAGPWADYIHLGVILSLVMPVLAGVTSDRMTPRWM